MDKAYIEVSVCRGGYESPMTVRIPLDDLTTREVFEPLEMSNDPMALLLHSLPRQVDYVKVRKQVIAFRGYVAQAAMDRAREELERLFAARDKLNGYDKKTDERHSLSLDG